MHKSHRPNDTRHLRNIPCCPFSRFFSELFFLHLSQTLFSCSALTRPSLLLFPHLPLLCRFIFLLSPDIFPGCVAETSELSRGICGQHPCLLFSLFPLSCFIHLSLFLLLHDSPMNTSFPPPASFLHSLVPLRTCIAPTSLPPPARSLLSLSA